LNLEAPVAKEREDAAVAAHNTRRGLIRFAVYTIVYGGFMLLSAFWPEAGSMPFPGVVSPAAIYGFTLILAALVVALAHWKFRRKPW
jgi:uncharacterized membrane protein (DUF485 family)